MEDRSSRGSSVPVWGRSMPGGTGALPSFGEESLGSPPLATHRGLCNRTRGSKSAARRPGGRRMNQANSMAAPADDSISAQRSRQTRGVRANFTGAGVR